jgi:hypothetical protein
VSYPALAITMSTLKVVIPLMLDDTLNVSVAIATSFAPNVVPSRFQVTVIGPLALAGVQFSPDMLNVTCVVPRFFT